MNTKMKLFNLHIILNVFLFLILLFSTFSPGNYLVVHAQAVETDLTTITLLPGTVNLAEEIENAVISALEQGILILPHAEFFAITDMREIDHWVFVSVVGLAESDDTLGWVLDDGVWFGLILLKQEKQGHWLGATQGTMEYSNLLTEIPHSVLNATAKINLDPLVQGDLMSASNAQTGYIFPWQSGTTMFYGSQGVHNNGFPGVVSEWKSVDMMSDGNTGAGHAPNRLLASEAGTISYKCNDGTSVAVKIGNFFYTHLLNNSNLNVGSSFNQGGELGQMKSGSFSASCGYADQGAGWFHVHWGFPNTDLNVEGWTLSMSTQNWTKESTTVSPGSGWITTGSNGGNNPPTGYTLCANEGGRCNFSGTANVVYGALNTFTSPRSFTNGVDCNNGVFGDPLPGTAKACYFGNITPPSCNYNSDQIVLYEHPNYSGTCRVLGIGDYANPGAMGFSNDAASSIKVGSTVKALLYENDNYVGVSEEFTADDSDFGNNSIGHDRVSSVKVQLRGCNPNSNQIALYAGTSYTGACVTLGIGEYSNPGSLNPVGNDNAESIRVGSNVQSVLCEHDNYQGRCSTLSSDEINLGNQTIGGNSISSVKVQTRAPVAPALISPVFSQSFDEGQAITLSWSATGSEYYGEIWGGPAGTTPFGWQTGTSRNIGSQWAGYVYSWRVKARNSNGESPWSSTGIFMVRPAWPSNLNASVISCSQINLSWTDNSGIEEVYRVYRNGNVIATLPGGSTSYQDTGLSASTPYSYQVTAHRVGGVESNFSNTAPATTPNCNVTPPSLLTPTNGAIIDEGQAITLSWTATGNEYFGEVTGGPGGTLTFGWQTGTAKNIGSQWAGYDYSWQVKARNGSTESVWSSIRTFRVRPGMPGNLSASASSCSQINLSWSDNSGNEEGYRVYRNGSPIATLPGNSNSYQNTGLSASTPYSYIVKAYRGSIESSSSNTASATTSPCPLLPSANFDAFPLSGAAPFTTTMHIINMSGIATCSWNYGDGQTSTACTQLHDHTYSNTGTYTVSLTVSGPGGSDTKTISNYITVSGPSAEFDAFPTSGDSPLDVEFHIVDMTGITTCSWDYGDGTPNGSSCDSIHPHRYTNPGRYTVTFTASGPGGSDSRTRTDYIVVNGSCLPVNLIKNPSFEADTNNDIKPDLWSTNAKFTRSSETTPKQGSYVGRFRATDNSGATITQTVPNLTAGTTYDFSAWVNIPPQGDTTFTFKLQVQWKNASNGNISTTLVKNYTTVTSGWNEATIDLVAPPGTVSAIVKMVASSLNGTIYVDDFYFGTIDCPQTIPDLIIDSITPLPANPQIGQAVSFSVVIKNQGTADAAGFYVDFFIDNPLPSSCGGIGQVYQYIPGLAAAASQTITLAYSGFSMDGSHTVNGLIDTDCVVDEDNDTNNSKSITLTVGNLIFANSFEDDDCFVTQWTSCVDDGGDLQFTDPPAPLKDNASMIITVDDNNPVYVTSDHPDAEQRYRGRFYFDPNSISMVSGNAHFILYGYNGTSKVVLRVEFRNSSGSYQLRAGLLNDASNWTNSSWFTITDAPHFIEFDWRAASVAGANNGGLTLWIDGVQKANLAAVDNDMWRIDRVRLGAVNGIDAGTRGTYFFDSFESGRETYIGP